MDTNLAYELDFADLACSLPVAAPAAPVASSAANAAHHTGTGQSAPFEVLHDAKVMIVDDDPLMVDAVQSYLEETGYSRFVTTSNPLEAFDTLEKSGPDIVLLDLVMPEINGFEILQSIRADDRFRYTPVIILTAQTDPEARLQALELGATDFLTKPVDPSELRLRLRNALAFKAYQDRLADIDPLTGLLNRTKFQAEVSTALSNIPNSSYACAAIHVDVDRFKQINDSLGQRAGDQLLRRVGQAVERAFREGEVNTAAGQRESVPLLARTSSNGFTAFVPNLHNLLKADKATTYARRVMAELSQPYDIEGHEIFVTTSIGIAISPGDGNDAEALLKHAEMAMYQAKSRGGNFYEFFSGDMNARSMERLSLENQLRRAVEREELVLFYQPKVDIWTQKITGAEALVRWKHPTLGFVPPSRFIPIAEETGQIVEIGQWVLRTACQQAREWANQGLPPIPVAVNVSGAQFRQGKVWHAVQGALQRTGLPPHLLTLELTESVLMENADESVDMLYELREMGISLSIDDFGTGYSSFTYLTRFPIDTLKIDRSFITGLPSERDSIAIVGSIIALSNEMCLSVVAEGVENSAQLDFLRARRCEEYQGYLCSRPAPAKVFASLLQNNGRSREPAVPIDSQ